ncbi:MAG: MBL fold metallo-hydrolase [Chromatiales bacterium]|jgi:glyoxylase-like metal-dependent hydrolase (beta-lactamase superfamily II)|nr:MBL fold metallo-hydrolase [Chromatiales bacterium]MDX9766854.1 MBL fold metallo-hydrolase [Ectothiorhodospiraceae bacterium]
MIRSLLLTVALLASAATHAEEETLGTLLVPLQVADGVYYFKGSLEARTFENDAFNLNTGFVVTDAGVVLIDSGPSTRAAQAIERAVATVTDKPIRYVINTGSQDHRWLGNAYFADKGVAIVALARTVETQQREADRHMERIQRILMARFEGTRAVTAEAPVLGDRHGFRFGGRSFELIYGGDAHFPGDVIVWLPESRVAFSGDLVYLDRILGIHPWTSILGLQKAYAALVALEPALVVPGHGAAADMTKVQAETGDYYDFLIDGVTASLAEWEELDQAVERLSDAPQFGHLLHFDEWHRANVNRVYLQLEAR